MNVLVVRHAHAGDPQRWAAGDGWRPLSKKGRVQAASLVELLADHPIGRIVSSPSARCVQTVEPLAVVRAMVVDEADEIGLDADSATTLAYVIAAATDDAALCSHREVIAELVRDIDARGVPLHCERDEHGDPPWAKGSVWVLGVVDGAIASGTYLPPP